MLDEADLDTAAVDAVLATLTELIEKVRASGDEKLIAHLADRLRSASAEATS